MKRGPSLLLASFGLMALVPLALAPAASADSLILRDGTRVEGDIIKSTGILVILRDENGDLLSFAKDRIAEIRRDGQATVRVASPAPRPAVTPRPAETPRPPVTDATPRPSNRNTMPEEVPTPGASEAPPPAPAATPAPPVPVATAAPVEEPAPAAAVAEPWGLHPEVSVLQHVSSLGILTPTTYLNLDLNYGPYLGAYAGGGYGFSIGKYLGYELNEKGEEVEAKRSLSIIAIPVGVKLRLAGAYLGGGASVIIPLKGYTPTGSLLKQQVQPEVTAGYSYRFPFGLGIGLDLRYGFPLSATQPQFYGGGLAVGYEF